MHGRVRRNRVGSWGLLSIGLAVAIAVVPVAAVADTFTVTSLADGDVSDSGTFRWAVNQANKNDNPGAGVFVADTITFDLSLVTLADTDRVLQIVLNSAPLEITSILTIQGPTDDVTDPANPVEYFVDIVRDPTIGEEFVVNETLTLFNAELRSNAIVFFGGTSSSSGTVDLVYDIGNFVHDLFWFVVDHDEAHPVVTGDKRGRLVKTGAGELALLPTTADYGAGTLLVDGVLRTDTRSLQGDIQVCADGIGETFISANCDKALLIFEMPSLTLDSNALRSTPPTNGTYAGDITGDSVGGNNGRVVKTGVGTLTLTGSNSYKGGTYVMQGALVGDTDAIQGDVHICPSTPISKPNGGTDITCNVAQPPQLSFDIATISTFAGELFGQGIVAKEGTAQLTLDTSHTQFAGNLEVNAGRLVVGDALTDELGSLTTAASEVYVTVNSGGTLAGAGTINGDVVVEAGGALEGSLFLAADLNLRGTLELTDKTMTGTVATFENGSVIAMDLVGATPAPGRLDLNGTLNLAAGSVEVSMDPAFVLSLNANDERFYTVAEADVAVANTLTGGEAGNGIRFQSAIFDLGLLYNDTTNCGGPKNVCLHAVFDPVLRDDAQTGNQIAIAGALDQAFLCAQNPTSPGCGITQAVADDFATVFASFAVPAKDIPGILDGLAGEGYAAFSDLRSAAAARFNRSISRRFDLELGGEPQDPAEQPGSSKAEPADQKIGDVSAAPGTRWETLGASARNQQSQENQDYHYSPMAWRRRQPKEPMPMDRHAGRGGFTGWLDVHGVMGELGGNANANDVDYRIYGPLFGIDYGVSENVTAGLTLGYTRNEIKIRGAASKGQGNTYQGGVYVGAVFEDLYLTGAARYAYSDLETRRRIRIGNLVRTARADFDASDAAVFLEAAYTLPVPGVLAPNILVQPTFAIAYNHLSQGGFDENGADSLNLEIDKQELDTLQTSIGVRIAMFGRDAENRYLLPQLRLAYEREWLDQDRPVSARLPSAGQGGAFELKGLALPRDRAVVGVSSEVGVSDRVSLFVDYDLRASKDLLEHSLAFGLRAIW